MTHVQRQGATGQMHTTSTAVSRATKNDKCMMSITMVYQKKAQGKARQGRIRVFTVHRNNGPSAKTRKALGRTNATIERPSTPLPKVTHIVERIRTIRRIVFVAVSILMTGTTGVVRLHGHNPTMIVLLAMPHVLISKIFCRTIHRVEIS